MAGHPKRHPALALAAVAALLAQQASAGTRTGTLSVQATVSSACALTTATMDFGTYYAGAAGNRDIAGTVGYVKCYNAALTVELDGGQNASGAARNMKSGASLLRYEIYQDSARTKVLSTGTNALPITSDATGEASVPIYGRIFSGQVVPAGSYADTVGIVLTF
jgi:spore coat protein U-like protein